MMDMLLEEPTATDLVEDSPFDADFDAWFNEMVNSPDEDETTDADEDF